MLKRVVFWLVLILNSVGVLTSLYWAYSSPSPEAIVSCVALVVSTLTHISARTHWLARPASNTVVQVSNFVGGDLAGRDVVKTVVLPSNPSTLRELVEKLRKECAEDKVLTDYIESLQHYCSPARYRPVRGLGEKLAAGHREDLIPSATELKERFVKKLMRCQTSDAAQQVFVHVLSRIRAFFELVIRPLVVAGAPRAEIDSQIYNKLLLPMYDEIGANPLNIDLDDLQGMLYFLTGNCHIQWD